MRELNWKELKNSEDKSSTGEGSLDVSHLLAVSSKDDSGEEKAVSPVYIIEETPSNAGSAPEIGRKDEKNTREKSAFSYQRIFFPVFMLILALMLVLLYVLLAKIGSSGNGVAAAEFVQGMSPLGFSSLFYIFFFLPAVLLLYHLIPGHYARPIILLVASLVFYSFAQPVCLALLLLTCFFNYIAGIELSARVSRGRKAESLVIGIFGIAGNLLLPMLYVFLPWAGSLTGANQNVPNLALPLGLMFLTLRAVIYLTDIWRETIAAETDFFIFSLYYTFFPTIALGPIEHYEKIRPAFARIFSRKKDFRLGLFGSGVERFLFGFFKKTILASPLYVLTLRIQQVPETENTVFLAWILALTYALWLMLELSSYADMAVGTARMLGFSISESFDHPFLARSVRDFWRRWQITVTGWLRDTIYRPVFGESGNHFRRLLGILLAAGIFAALHGPKLVYFILAAYMGFLLFLDTGAAGRLFARFPDILRWFLTAILLLVASAILLGDSSANVFSPVLALFGGVSGGVANATMLYLLRTHFVLIAFSIAAVSGLFLMIYRVIRRRVPVAAIILLLLVFGLALCACIGEAAPDTFMRIALGAG